MLKHMLTTNCPRSCEYCITRNINADECTNLDSIEFTYDQLCTQHKEINLTGGEPTKAKCFMEIVELASTYFNIHLTTQNAGMLNSDRYTCLFDSIMYSLHDGLMNECVTVNTTVYGAILDQQYTPELPHKLKARGFSGLTINEEQREGKSFDVDLPEIDGFSIRVNRVGHCMDETIILPNLQVITDFREYL